MFRHQYQLSSICHRWSDIRYDKGMREIQEKYFKVSSNSDLPQLKRALGHPGPDSFGDLDSLSLRSNGGVGEAMVSADPVKVMC